MIPYSFCMLFSIIECFNESTKFKNISVSYIWYFLFKWQFFFYYFSDECYGFGISCLRDSDFCYFSDECYGFGISCLRDSVFIISVTSATDLVFPVYVTVIVVVTTVRIHIGSFSIVCRRGNEVNLRIVL